MGSSRLLIADPQKRLFPLYGRVKAPLQFRERPPM
jgi:hypothetical protein